MVCWPEYRRTWELIGRGPHLYRYRVHVLIHCISSSAPCGHLTCILSAHQRHAHFPPDRRQGAQQVFDRELKLAPNRPSFGTCFASPSFQRETRGPMIDANNDLEHAPSAVPLSQEARTIGRRRSGERDRSGARAAEQFAAGAQVRVKLGPRTASWCAGQEGTVISIGRQVEIDLGGRICKINPNELELLVSEELDASLLQLAEDISMMAPPAPSPPAPTPPAAEPNGAVRAAAAAEATVQSPRRRSPSSEERRQQQQGGATSAAAAAVHAGVSRRLGVSRRERGISSGASVVQGAAADDEAISDAAREAAVPAARVEEATVEAVEAETTTDPTVEGSATEDAEGGGGVRLARWPLPRSVFQPIEAAGAEAESPSRRLRAPAQSVRLPTAAEAARRWWAERPARRAMAQRARVKPRTLRAPWPWTGAMAVLCHRLPRPPWQCLPRRR